MSDAFAQETTAMTAATTAPGEVALQEPSPLMTAMPMLLIFVVFYFLIIRPQQKKIREHNTMIKAVRRGDKVVTGGGIVATVVKVEDETLQLEIAPGIQVKVVADTITSVISRTGDAEEKEKEPAKLKKSANDN